MTEVIVTLKAKRRRNWDAFFGWLTALIFAATIILQNPGWWWVWIAMASGAVSATTALCGQPYVSSTLSTTPQEPRE